MKANIYIYYVYHYIYTYRYLYTYMIDRILKTKYGLQFHMELQNLKCTCKIKLCNGEVNRHFNNLPESPKHSKLLNYFLSEKNSFTSKKWKCIA